MSTNKPLVSKVAHAILPIGWLTLVWCALWRDFSVPFVVCGAVLSILVVAVFRLPPLIFSNRFNLWYALKFVVLLLWNIALASFQVLWLALVQGPGVCNSVVAVQLRTQSDLLLTGVSHTMSVIPGSVVIEVDRSLPVLYFHVLNVSTQEDIERFRAQVAYFESLIIKAVGSRREYESIRADEAMQKEMMHQ